MERLGPIPTWDEIGSLQTNYAQEVEGKQPV